MQYKNDEIIPVKDFYRNIPGKGKIKELTKNKVYKCIVEHNHGVKYYYVETDLGDTKMYSKKNMFISKVNLRDQKLNNLLDEL